MSLFEDVTKSAFPKEWKVWNHSGYPRSHQGTPTFVDVNGDGWLDYFYNNHYQGDPSQDWDFGMSYGTNRGDSAFFKSIGDSVLSLTEPEGSKWKTPEKSMDTHGTAMLDIDRDGYLDLYMAAGGGVGKVYGPAKNAVLMWGSPPDGSSSGMDRVQRFAGGRDVSEVANLHNPDSRGRFNYFVDFNQDGLLDVVYSNEPRDDTINAYGVAMLNTGNRTFATLDELQEYTETMILTDADGDGHAEEFVVQRRDCTPKACDYRGDKTCTNLKKQDAAWYDFCRQRPESTTAIYKWSSVLSKLEVISPPTESHTLGADEHATSMQTADFDGDGVADLAVLYPSGIHFFYSSKRSKGDLPIGSPSEKVSWSTDECDGTALRAADLNLDGHQELLVLCFSLVNDKPTHRMYTGTAQLWSLVNNKEWLGDLVNPDLVHPEIAQMQSVCVGEVQKALKGYLRKGCEEFLGMPAEGQLVDGHLKQPRAMGLSVIDWNNDGFHDVVLSYDFGNLLMLQNNWGQLDSAKDNHFLAVKLKGIKSNEYGIGATVILRCSNMNENGDEDVLQLREVYSAGHETDWLGTRDDRLVFGLGPHGVPESILVRWPNGKTEQLIEDKQLLVKKMDSMSKLLLIVESSSSDSAMLKSDSTMDLTSVAPA